MTDSNRCRRCHGTLNLVKNAPVPWQTRAPVTLCRSCIDAMRLFVEDGMETQIQRLMRERQAANDAWQAELVRVYGRTAGDARYGRAGKATPKLAQLHEAYRQASAAVKAYADVHGYGF